MIETYNSGGVRDKKMLQEAQSMLSDAKRKIEYIRMQIVRLENQRSHAASAAATDCMSMFFEAALHALHYTSLSAQFIQRRYMILLLSVL